MPMPPLVWRERIVLCENCQQEVSLEDPSCPKCHQEFEEHPEVRERKRDTRSRIFKDISTAAAIVSIVISSSILVISLLLDYLHRWVQPIDQNFFPYIGIMTIGMFGAVIAIRFGINPESRKSGTIRLWKMAPFAILFVFLIGILLIIFSDDVDRFLATSTWSVESIMATTIISGIIVLAVTSKVDDRSKKRVFT